MKLTRESGLSINIEPRDFEVFPGSEYLIVKSKSNRGKKKKIGGSYRDRTDGGDVFVDLLTGEEENEFEVWFWKPIPGSLSIEAPDWSDFRFEPQL